MEYHIFFVNGTITLSLRQIMIIVFLQGNIMGLLATGIRNYAISANQFNSSSRANNQENTKVNNKLNTQGNNIKSNIHKIREVLIKFFSNFKDFKIWKSSSDAQQFISNIDTETSNSNVQNHLNPIIIETLPSDDVVRALVKIKASIPLMKYLLEQPFSNVVGIKILIHAEDGDELYITRSKTGVDLLMETAEQSSASSTYFGAEKSNILDSFIDNDIKNEKLVAFCDFGILQYATQHKGDYNSQVQNEMATRDMVGSLYETYKAATKEATANSSNLSLNPKKLS